MHHPFSFSSDEKLTSNIIPLLFMHLTNPDGYFNILYWPINAYAKPLGFFTYLYLTVIGWLVKRINWFFISQRILIFLCISFDNAYYCSFYRVFASWGPRLPLFSNLRGRGCANVLISAAICCRFYSVLIAGIFVPFKEDDLLSFTWGN